MDVDKVKAAVTADSIRKEQSYHKACLLYTSGWAVLETNARDGKGVGQFSTVIRQACQYTGLHYQHEEIAHIGCRGTIKNACPLAMQHKVFHLLGEKLLSASQSDGGKKEAGKQCQGNHIIRTTLTLWLGRRRLALPWE